MGILDVPTYTRTEIDSRLSSVEDRMVSASSVQQGTADAPEPTMIWTLQPANEERGPFNWLLGGARFNDTFDPVMYFGYNIADGGGRAKADEPSFRFVIEADYDVGAPSGETWLEAYFEFSHPNETAVRPIFMRFNRQDGSSAGFDIRCKSLAFTSYDDDVQFAALSKGVFALIAQDDTDNSLAIQAGSGRRSVFLMHHDAAPSATLQLVTLTTTQVAASVAGAGVLWMFRSGDGGRLSIGTQVRDSTLSVQGTGEHVLTTRSAASGQTQDHIRLTSADADTVFSRFNGNGYFMTRKSTPPANNELANGEGAIWIDTASGELRWRSKTADGVIADGALSVE